MTNEEYIQDFCKQCHEIAKYCGNPEHGHIECNLLLHIREALKWKDQLFKAYLEKKKAKLLLLQDNVSNQREFDLIDYRISLIEEIINELFGETKTENLLKPLKITEDDFRKMLDDIFEGSKEKFQKQFEEWLLSGRIINVKEENK